MGAGVFGYVAINGNTIVSQGGDPSVYVFVKPVNGWADATETAMLTARRGQRKNHFCFSVALTTNLIAVRAPFQDAPGVANAGAVYVYVKPITGWKTVDVANARLRASDGGVGAGLGFYVTVSGNTVAAGAPTGGVAGSSSAFRWCRELLALSYSDA